MQNLSMIDLDAAVSERQRRLRATAIRHHADDGSDRGRSHPVRVWIGHRLIALGGALAGAAPRLPELSSQTADSAEERLRTA